MHHLIEPGVPRPYAVPPDPSLKRVQKQGSMLGEIFASGTSRKIQKIAAFVYRV